MKNAIEIKNVCKNYQDFRLDNVSFSVPTGTIMGFVGENGAGKTTLIKSIMNITAIDQGTITVFGLEHDQKEKVIKEDIGAVLDDSFFSDYLNPKEIGRIMQTFYQNWDPIVYEKYLQEFHLPRTKIYKEYSRGMKIKLQIACALSHHPKLLLLDEPTSGLDSVVRNEILDIFMDFIKEEDHTILLSTHITSDLEHIADYITFIKEGKIIFTKDRETLLEEYGIVKCSADDFKKMRRDEYLCYKENRYDYEVLVDKKKEIKRHHPNLVVDKPTIEDIMVLYGKGIRA